MRLDRAGHRGRGLAGANDNRPAQGRLGKICGHSLVGGGRRDRSLEHLPQQLPLFHRPRPSGRSLVLAYFVVSEPLEHARHARMIPGRATRGGGGVEQLLTGGCIRQADAERARALEREVQVLLMQRNPEAWLEIALDHAFAMDLENAGGRKSAHQRLPHASRIRAGLGGEDQRLADRLDRQSAR